MRPAGLRTHLLRAAVVPLLALAGIALLWSFLDHNHRRETRMMAEQYASNLGVAYAAAVNLHRLNAEAHYEAYVTTPAVLDLLRQANEVDAEALPVVRGRLYRQLLPVYRKLQTQGLRELHFHTRRSESLLRFHRPERAGDSIADVRPAVRMANERLRAVSGFEGGRVLPGFRYIFPIVVDRRHYGSVEFSLPFEEIHRELDRLLPGSEIALMLSRAVTVDLVFAEHRNLFSPSPLHPELLIEHPDVSRLSGRLADTANASALMERLSRHHAVHAAISAGSHLALPLIIDGQGYLVSLHAIRDIAGERAGFIVAHTQAPQLLAARASMRGELAIGSLLILLCAFAAQRLLQQRRELRLQRSRLQAITEHMDQGLYVLDAEGRATYINGAASRMLGYTAEELRGEIIHDLIHNHARSDHMPLAQCPAFNATRRLESFRGIEWFVGRDKRLFPVELSCRPLIEDGVHIGSVNLFTDITERKAREDELVQQATTDPLTGLANRRRFMLEAEHELARVQRYNHGESTLLMIDLDHFKDINDNYGHSAGDAVLLHLADLLRHNLRALDLAGRYGGEEFVILLPSTSADEGWRLAERLRLALANSPTDFEGLSIAVTMSIGLTTLRAGDRSMAAVIERADEALYSAKEGGRNRVEMLAAAQPAGTNQLPKKP